YLKKITNLIHSPPPPPFWGPLGKRIYGHSRFCNTDFDDKWACLNLSGV
ncbi:hypothetical protein GY446_002348, partial [Salmonella enterica subsp. houtenae]|nr:hypothetical protein [Salmonella enterica subsp. houtenae]